MVTRRQAAVAGLPDVRLAPGRKRDDDPKEGKRSHYRSPFRVRGRGICAPPPGFLISRFVPKYGSGTQCTHNRVLSMSPVETRTVELKVRIRPSLKRAVDRAAGHDGRSLSNWIERLLEEAVAKHPSAGRSKRNTKSFP
jgi:hypothetical protein